jgi:hypothetical protein
VPMINHPAARVLEDLEVDAVSMFMDGVEVLELVLIKVDEDYILRLNKMVKKGEESLDIKLRKIADDGPTLVTGTGKKKKLPVVKTNNNEQEATS